MNEAMAEKCEAPYSRQPSSTINSRQQSPVDHILQIIRPFTTAVVMDHQHREVSDLPPKKKPKLLTTNDVDDGAAAAANLGGAVFSAEDHNMKEETIQNNSIAAAAKCDEGVPDTRKCELCEGDRPRSCYSKKQWNKPYGGWNCQACSAEQRAKQRNSEHELSQQDKQNRHDQKVSDQAAKTKGTFQTERRCLTCHSIQPRTAYSGKQWKQLFRECQECVQVRQDSKNRQPPRAKVSQANTNFVDRLCSSCREIKHKPDFSPKQWKNPQDADRLCKECWAEEEEAKEDHRVIEAEEKKLNPALIDKKRCFACHEFKDKKYFSGKQQKKAYGICAPCVLVVQEERHRQKTARICSACQEEKGWDNFAREQWKTNKAERRCRPCAAVHVCARDEHRLAEQMEQRDKKEEDAATRLCFSCTKFHTEDGFSGRQWTKTYATCKTCSATVLPDINNVDATATVPPL